MSLSTFICRHLCLLSLLLAGASSPAVHAQSSGGSVCDLDSTWHDKDGHSIRLSSFAGRPHVLAMGYTSCQYACPRIIADMRAIERALPAELRSQVTFTFVSFDPVHDTPAHLRAFQARNDLDHWLFLTGDEDGVLDLSVALGIQFKKTPGMGFAHSNAVFVLSREGRIVHRQEALGESPEAAVKALLQALHRP
jgi:protein SCO1/2